MTKEDKESNRRLLIAELKSLNARFKDADLATFLAGLAGGRRAPKTKKKARD